MCQDLTLGKLLSNTKTVLGTNEDHNCCEVPLYGCMLGSHLDYGFDEFGSSKDTKVPLRRGASHFEQGFAKDMKQCASQTS